MQYRCHGYYVTYFFYHKKVCTVRVSWSTASPNAVTTTRGVLYWCHESLRDLSLSQLKGMYSTGVMVYYVIIALSPIKCVCSTSVMAHYVTYLCHHIDVLQYCCHGLLRPLTVLQLDIVHSTGVIAHNDTYLCHS